MPLACICIPGKQEALIPALFAVALAQLCAMFNGTPVNSCDAWSRVPIAGFQDGVILKSG